MAVSAPSPGRALGVTTGFSVRCLEGGAGAVVGFPGLRLEGEEDRAPAVVGGEVGEEAAVL
ncbi:MAG: hypothetical protein M3Q10_04605, partial [Chloroflexota bacterium]|nr:hypothetical protein [Chloroflexota bacterium]